MRNVWVLSLREFASNFSSPVAYVAISVFLAVVGIKFFLVDAFFEVGEANLRSFFELLPMFFVFFIPAIAMRLVSEEKRQGTYELLSTLPVSDFEVILGKFLGAFGFLALALVATLVYPLFVSSLGNPDFGAIWGGYIGLLFIGGTFLAVGLMTSTWTQSQLTAYILGAVVSGLFFYVDAMLGSLSQGLKTMGEYISFNAHFQNFAKGVVDTRDVVFFLSVTALALLVATFTLSRRRWN